MAPDQTASVPAGWYPDPYGVSEMRWWDGQSWTDSIHPQVAQEEPSVQPVPAHHTPEPVSPEPVVPEPVSAQPLSPEPDPFQELGFTESHQQDDSVPDLVEPAQPAEEPHHYVSGSAPSAALPNAPLPSRRELRMRAEQASSTSDAPASSVPAEPVRAIPAAEAPVSAAALAAPPVPDSSTPSSFDWLAGAGAPAASAAGASPPPAFPPPGVSTNAAPAELPFAADSDEAPPVPVVNAWSRPTTLTDDDEIPNRPTATRMATTSSWFIAVMPLIAGILSLSAVKGQENYPTYVPAGIEWWMLVAGVFAVLYVVTLMLAMADRRKLDWAGYHRPAHWAWALLTAPVYLLVRTISVKRETGRNSMLLWVWILLTALLVAAWFAAGYFAPELIEGYKLPFL